MTAERPEDHADREDHDLPGSSRGPTLDDLDDLDASLALHDDLIARRGVEIWIGAEPTFTRADSLDPAWTSAADGDDKRARAHALAVALGAQLPGATVSRVVGRQFPDEAEPRFAFGVRWPAAGHGAGDGGDGDGGDGGGGDGGGGGGNGDGGGAGDGGGDGAGGAGGAGGGGAGGDGAGGDGAGGAGDSAPPPGAPCAIDARPAPPPSDPGGDHWLTVTPDPGVVEVNMAPCASVRSFARQAHAVWTAARAAGLSASRVRFNGDVADAGGGGQLSIGGPRPEHSPFVRYPHVLPALIRYVNNHPSLSYWFANECVGSASQGPRPDEGARERWDELGVTLGWLEQLADRGELAAEQLWRALGSLLVDSSGNAHRAELNVEKLWNPHIAPHGPRHGKMGLVELRAIRMPERPAMFAALAVLVRSLVARLAVSDYRAPLIDWHDELHDRFALPAALSRDLRLVLGDLDEHGLGVPAQLRAELEAWRPPGITGRLGDATLTLRPALEFWPLVGDVASQERAGARIVDASTQRWELAIEGPGPDRLVVSAGHTPRRWAQLRSLGDGVRAVGVRRRIYPPLVGFHPGLPATDPLTIEWAWADRVQRIDLWAWRPGGGPYTGLPLDECEAIARRQERIAVVTRSGELTAAGHWPEPRPFTIDLRTT